VVLVLVNIGFVGGLFKLDEWSALVDKDDSGWVSVGDESG
jgi:hypothetical protein